MIHEFNDTIEVETPVALFIESSAHEVYWTVAIQSNRAIVTFRQNKLRISKHYTIGLGVTDEEMKTIVNV